MRPTLLFSAALYGVLWTSSNLVSAQTSRTDGIHVCDILYTDPPCQASCRENQALTNEATLAGCTKVNPGVSGGSITVDSALITYLITSTMVNVNQIPITTVTSTMTGPLVYATIISGIPTTLTRTPITSDAALTAPTPTGSASQSLYMSSTVSEIQSSTTSVSANGNGVDSNAKNTPAIAAASGKTNTGAIVGGVIGGILAVALILLGAFFIRRRRHRRSSDKSLDEFGQLEKNRDSSSPSVYPTPVPQAISYDSPAPVPLQGATPGEGHRLMSNYGDQIPDQGIHNVSVVAPKPYTVGTREREVDEDGVSLRSPSPTLVGGEGGRRENVPRLPIYNRGSDETPRGSAL